MSISATLSLSFQRQNRAEPPYLWTLPVRKKAYYSMKE